MPDKAIRETRACQQCGSPFLFVERLERESQPRFCSRGCYHASKQMVFEQRNCQECGKQFSFRVTPSRIKENRGRYCGLSCAKRFHGSLKERFLKFVEKSDGCWFWLGNRDHDGYGRWTVPELNTRIASRAAYKLFVGPIPDGMSVLHKCDNGADGCVNPGCLFLGTHNDNMADMVRKGRKPKGSAAVNAKLTEEQVLEIRRLAAMSVTFTDLAKKFGVSDVQIGRIVHRRFWRHV